MSFLAELRRRNVFRVGAAYAIVAWLVIQVAVAILPQLQLPAWSPTLVTVLLLLGFPIALVLAWALELTDEGIRLTRRDGATPTAEPARGGIVDYALIAGLVLVAGAILWDRRPETRGAGASAAASGPSIAVLPFADMSPNKDQAYFGDGIAEELLNELARLEGLRVAGRTSSFAYRGDDKDLRAIGEALNVVAILEGSIRKDGNRVRITAQLVNSSDGYHLWSETFDRELEDIFAIQEEIATAVAGELGVRLGVGGVNAFKGAGTRNVQAYEAYLQGASSRLTDMKAAQRLFYRAIELDPNYAAAWSQRGLVTASSMWRSLPEEAPAILDGALSYVARAVELDPDSAQAHSLFGTVRYAQLDWIAGQEAHMKALSLLADRPTLEQHGNLLMRTGRLEAAAAQFEAARAVEPMDERPAELAMLLDIAQGRFAEAREILSRRSGTSGNMIELDLAINERDPEGVKRALSRLERVPIAPEALHSAVLAEFESRAAVLATLRSVYADESVQWPTKLHEIAMLAAYFGDPELALEAKGKEARWTPVRLFAAWYPIMAEARKLPAFKTLATDLDLVEYWRAYGWADACRPVGETDFACR